MSIFSKIESAEHTFAGWFEKELAKLVKDAPTFFTIADNTLAYVGPILVTVLDAIGQTSVAAEAQTVINQALQDVIVLRGVLEDAGPTLTAKSLLASIQTNLQGLLTGAHISDVANVTLINKVLGELAALLAAFPTTTAPATTATA